MHKVSFFLSIFLLAGTAQADDAAKLAATVQKVYDKVDAYAAEFENEFTARTTKHSVNANGQVKFKKPGKMRWTYKAPTFYELITDGKTFWHYQPEEKQVIVADPEAFLNNRASVLFLGGGGKLTEEFNLSVAEAPKGAAPGKVLQLVPKTPDATFNKVLLIIDPKTGLVGETWVYDFMNNTTRVRFTNVSTERKLEDSAFVFKAPKGIDVIDQRRKTK